jgi:hypothetical protein
MKKGEILKRENWIIFVSVIIVLLANVPWAYSLRCDQAIEKQSMDNWELKYRKRGNRCEGFYKSDVSIGVLDVVGTTVGKFQFKTNEKEVMEISSPIVTTCPVNVRAVGVPLKTYYRMDSTLDPNETLHWPVGDVINLKKLSDRDIGVFGWIEGKIETFYVPVVINSRLSPVKNDGKIRFYLRASVKIEAVKWRVILNSGEVACNQISDNVWKKQQWCNMQKSSYQAGKLIEIVLPSNKTDQTCLQVAGRDKNGQWLFNWSRVIVSQDKK